MNVFIIQLMSAVLRFKTTAMYIDPSTTSYLIQIVVGAVIAVGTVLGVYRNKIKNFFKKKSGSADDSMNIKAKKDNEKAVVTADDLMDDE